LKHLGDHLRNTGVVFNQEKVSGHETVPVAEDGCSHAYLPDPSRSDTTAHCRILDPERSGNGRQRVVSGLGCNWLRKAIRARTRAGG
jgi:hypothetical protein